MRASEFYARNYLAKQVRKEAEKFGIQYVDIDQDNDLPAEFLGGKRLLITHVQKVFNGKSIFGLGTKSTNIGGVILDDSHACIDSIKNALTIKVNRDHNLYKILFSLFTDDLRDQGEGSYLEIEMGEYGTMLPIPYWSWHERRTEVTKAILANKDELEILFAWPILKDMIQSCQAFISGSSLEISPTLIPISHFCFFAQAKTRILMSATTQDDSFFIKNLDIDSESIRSPLSNPGTRWSGEKMVLIPSLVHDELERDHVISRLGQENEKGPFGVVFLVPTFAKKKQYDAIGAEVSTTKNIFESVQTLKDGDYSKTKVFVNRYDGIDLPDKSCRILILDSKPYFDSLMDRYEEVCRPSSDMINVKVAQKVEQGMGRSVRGQKDYSIIILVGGDLVCFVKSPNTTKYFSPQTRKQIEIGMKVAEFANEDSPDGEGMDILIGLINQALKRDDGWKTFYESEMNEIQIEEMDCHFHSIIHKEFLAEAAFLKGDGEKACQLAQELADANSNNPLEKGWYLQQAARYKYPISKVGSSKLQAAALRLNYQLLKPREGVAYQMMNYINENRNERIINLSVHSLEVSNLVTKYSEGPRRAK